MKLYPRAVAEPLDKVEWYHPGEAETREASRRRLVPTSGGPARLAWRQLRSEPARLLAAVLGVMFAAILVLMQLGFRTALFGTADALPRAIDAELFLVNPLTTALFRAEPVPRVRGYAALADPAVASVVPIYLAQAVWRNPQTGTHRWIQMIGFDPEAGAVDIPGIRTVAARLRPADTVAFDALSRPEYGDIPALLARDGSVSVQLGNRSVTVVGSVYLGASFAADGNVVMSDVTLRRLMPTTLASNPSVLAVRLVPGADPMSVRAKLRHLLPHDVAVLTHDELEAHEHAYWDSTTPIGVIFAFGSLLSIVVGMVIVYQILFTDIASHLREYATMKAMGFTNGYLSRVVISEALILAVLGFCPGLLASVVLYRYAAAATYLNLQLTAGVAALVFVLIVGMCMGAGLLTLRKLKHADPATMF